ncbi:MAG: DNA repair protein RecN [Syntrophomonadaceae bacterium]|nr:DNA repair protein RecN [Syntrophomonadaceae bacterium]
MLREIYIDNFVLIDNLRLEFSAGLNVLSGETGAGKSIVIDALNVALGERINAESIKDKNKKAVAEVIFDLPDKAADFLRASGLMNDDDTEVIFRREIADGGKHVQRINNRGVNLSLVKELAPLLLDMHLQHDSLRLLKTERQLEIIDGLLPQDKELPKKVKELYRNLRALQKELREAREHEQNKREQAEFLERQINEIKNAQLQAGEESELLALKARIGGAHKLLAAADKIRHYLYQNPSQNTAYDLIASSLETAQSVSEDEFYSILHNDIQDIYFNLQDLMERLSSFQEQIEFEPGLLEEVEERLFLFQRLKKRYGCDSIEEVMDCLARLETEKNELDHKQLLIDELLRNISVQTEELNNAARILSDARKKAASTLGKKVSGHLKELNLPHLRFTVEVSPAAEMNQSGQDQVAFMFSANPGEKMQPIVQVASGGEVSRFVLALKTSLAQTYNVPTMVFDEIDAGVGGTSLAAMALKIADLAQYHQVILVTHSPQIACYADHHLLITKAVKEGTTEIKVRALNYEERAAELARMLGGEKYTPLTLQHAREMLSQKTGAQPSSESMR